MCGPALTNLLNKTRPDHTTVSHPVSSFYTSTTSISGSSPPAIRDLSFSFSFFVNAVTGTSVSV